MPITYQNFEAYEQIILTKTVNLLKTNNDAQFPLWLESEAEMDVSNIYVDSFKPYYYGNLEEAIEERLALLGKTIVYGIKAYLLTKPECEINVLLEFTKALITTQMDNFDIDFEGEINWISEAVDYDPC